MAVDRQQFIEIVDKGIKADKNFNKFYINFKVEGKITQRIIDYSTKSWDKRTKIMQVKQELQLLRDKIINRGPDFRDTSSLNEIAKFYFENACSSSIKWNKEKKHLYNVYFSKSLGKKRIRDIKTSHIDTIRKQMEIKGQTKQTKNGCSPRTIKLILKSVLKPILQYAVDNKVIDALPTITVPKQHRKKKIVSSAKNKLFTLYKTIMELYKDNSFYRALFLFALFGRRFNEIATLEWEDIDMLNSTYTIKAKNNKIDEEQTYELPIPIAQALLDLKTDGVLVFPSFITGHQISTPKRQLAKLKKNNWD